MALRACSLRAYAPCTGKTLLAAARLTPAHVLEEVNTMVTTDTTAATNVQFRARTTTGGHLGDECTLLPAVRQDVHMDRLASAPAGFDLWSDATRVEIVAPTYLGHRAWSPPS